MNQFLSTNPAHCSGPISAATGDVRLSFGDVSGQWNEAMFIQTSNTYRSKDDNGAPPIT